MTPRAADMPLQREYDAGELPEGYGTDGRDTHTTAVIFRVWEGKDGGQVLALFPEIPHNQHGYLIMSYMHVGQHGAADYGACLRQTRRAKPEEYADLLAELSEPWPGFGYRLKVYQMETPKMRETFRAAQQKYQ